jgi:hypothetical protein
LEKERGLPASKAECRLKNTHSAKWVDNNARKQVVLHRTARASRTCRVHSDSNPGGAEWALILCSGHMEMANFLPHHTASR